MNELVKIAVLENEIEAGLLESILTGREISFNIMSYHDSAYDGLFQLHKGWGAVYGPTEFKNEILEILNDLRSE